MSPEMKPLLYASVILILSLGVAGETPNPCAGVADFDLCVLNTVCDVKFSRCTCFEEQPFCRCNSRKGEFCIGENCSQKWTVVTFALVASVPGLTLAALVGVIVYTTMLFSTQRHPGVDLKSPTTASKEQDLFPGITFASDLKNRPLSDEKPTLDNVPMAAMVSRPYNIPHNPPLDSPNHPYSPPSDHCSSADHLNGGRPSDSRMYSRMRDPPIRPIHPYSDGAGQGQIVTNPYVRVSPSRNPYEDQQRKIRAVAPSHIYGEMKQNQDQRYSSAPLYPSSEHANPYSGFPRPQLSLRY